MLIFVLKIALTIPVTVALVYPFLGYSENVGVFHEVQTAGSVGAVAIALFFLFLVFLYCRDLHRSSIRPSILGKESTQSIYSLVEKRVCHS